MTQYASGPGGDFKGIRTPLETLKDAWSMDPKERAFLEAAERGDKHTICRCLQPPNPVNVNCTDMLGRSAIQIAVDNENPEIVEILLKEENVFIGVALLYAIREGGYGVVEMLINHPSITTDMLAGGWAKAHTQGDDESNDYSPDISPVILAAHCNQFEILQLLLTRGAMIDKPHAVICQCQKCQMGKHTDSLRYSLRRIHTYRALASPAWISLTSTDPILVAFQLSCELDHLSQLESEFKTIYMELSKQCKKYSCDLLNLCRSTDEVIAVLDKKTDSESEDDFEPTDPNQLSLARLKLALKYEQKQFVAHPNCQQLLSSIWYDGIPNWRNSSGPVKVILCLGIIIGMPLVSLYYLVFPSTKFGYVIRSPFMKFFYRSASFGVFLILLVLASIGNKGTERNKQHIRGPPLTAVEWLIFFWVVGMVWGECKEVWDEGLRDYARHGWNWLDFVMLSAYITAFSLKGVSRTLVNTTNYGERVVDRNDWPMNDPTLIAEGFFALANVFSFARIIYLFLTNPHLGPLQISLGCMFKDIAKFLFIFFLVLISFACGLNQLFRHYESHKDRCKKEHEDETAIASCESTSEGFSSIEETFSSLFWSLFGVTSRKSTDLIENAAFTENLGAGLFLSYHVMATIVLVNMLIAMMTKSFEVIDNHADMEWKFARSKLWMGYFDDGSTLPPPFNLVISPKSIISFLQWAQEVYRQFKNPTAQRESTDELRKNTEDHGMKPTSISGSEESLEEITDKYQEVMKLLVTRYIHQAKKQLRQDGVNEDDLLEIKQDISSLRYELREDRKKEAAKNTLQIEIIKRDIIRSLREQGSGEPTSNRIPGQGRRTATVQSPRRFAGQSPRRLAGHSPGQMGLSPPGRPSFAAKTVEKPKLTQDDLNILKQAVITDIRKELQDIIREMREPREP